MEKHVFTLVWAVCLIIQVHGIVQKKLEYKGVGTAKHFGYSWFSTGFAVWRESFSSSGKYSALPNWNSLISFYFPGQRDFFPFHNPLYYINPGFLSLHRVKFPDLGKKIVLLVSFYSMPLDILDGLRLCRRKSDYSQNTPFPGLGWTPQSQVELPQPLNIWTWSLN